MSKIVPLHYLKQFKKNLSHCITCMKQWLSEQLTFSINELCFHWNRIIRWLIYLWLVSYYLYVGLKFKPFNVFSLTKTTLFAKCKHLPTIPYSWKCNWFNTEKSVKHNLISLFPKKIAGRFRLSDILQQNKVVTLSVY